MTTTINAATSTGLAVSSDGSGIVKLQSNGVTTNALAWVCFNGTTSPGTIRSAYNVSSVTKNGTGDYTANFTNALSDANYSSVCSYSYVSGDSSYNVPMAPYLSLPTTSAVRMGGVNYGSGSLYDSQYVSLQVFGN